MSFITSGIVPVDEVDPVDLSEVGVFRYDGHSYVIGLKWQSVDGRNVKEAALKGARSSDFRSRFCIVRDNRRYPQAGWVVETEIRSFRNVVRPGLLSGAASIANARPGSLLAALRIDGGYWVLVIRDGRVVADGDLFFPDRLEETARRAFDALHNSAGAGSAVQVFAPAEWHVPGAQEGRVSLLLDHRVAPILRPVEAWDYLRFIIFSRKGLTGVGIAFAVLSMSYIFWVTIGGGLFEDLRRQVPVYVPRPTARDVPRPWLAAYRPIDTVLPCVRVWDLGWNVPGWQLDSLTCDADSPMARPGDPEMVSMVWRRLPGMGVLDGLVAAYRAIGIDPLLGEEMNTGDVTVRFSIRRRRTGPPVNGPLSNSRDWRRSMGRFIEDAGYKMMSSGCSQREVRLGGRPVSKPPSCFGVSGVIDPVTFAGILGPVTGLVVRGVFWSATTGKWEIIGDVYDNAWAAEYLRWLLESPLHNMRLRMSLGLGA